MKVNTLSIIKNIAVFLLLFYVDAQLLNKLFAVKNVNDIIVYLVSLFFMLAILIAHSYLLYTKITPEGKETKND